MDKRVLDALLDMLRGELVSQLSWTAVVTLLTAAAGAYLGAYLAQKAKLRADQEEFAKHLGNELEKTLKTESVKAGIAEASTKALEAVRSELQRATLYTTFQRDLLARHQDALVSAARECTILCDMVKFKWEDQEITANRIKMVAHMQTILFSVEFLSTLHSIDESSAKDICGAVEAVSDLFEKGTSYKLRNSAKFRADYLGTQPVAVAEIIDAQTALMKAVKKMSSEVFDSIRASALPK